MIQVNRIYLIFNRLVTKKFLVDTSDKWIEESVSGARHPNVRKLGKILNTIDKGDTIYVTELSRLGRCAYMVIAIISHCLIAKANIVEIRDDKLIKDDSDSVQDTFLKVLFAQRE